MRRTPRLPAAVLWDFDGTLVDSESLWPGIESGLARDLGGELPNDSHEATLGGTITDTAAYIIRHTGADADPADVADELWRRAKAALASVPVRWMPGAQALVEALADAGVPQGVVSSGHRHYLDVTLRRLDPGLFGVVVAGDEVTHAKPHPEAYLTACAALGADPRDSLVIEDSPRGAAAGNAAGCAVLLVPTADEAPDAPRRAVVPTLEGLGLVGLAEIVGRLGAAPGPVP